MRIFIILALGSLGLPFAAVARDSEPPRPLTVEGIRHWQQTGALKPWASWPMEMKLDIRGDGKRELLLAILGFSRGMDYAVFALEGDTWKLLCDRVSCTPPLIDVLEDEHNGYHDFVTFQMSGRGGYIVRIYSWNGQKYTQKVNREITYDQLYGHNSPQAAHAGEGGDAESADHWKGVLARLDVGMRRNAVEAILGGNAGFADIDADPNRNRSLGRDDTHRVLYALDTYWCASITYDWAGFKEKDNAYGVLHEYEQRMVAPPVLLKLSEGQRLQRL